MCSHPQGGDAIAEKIAEKNGEKFNVLTFSRPSISLSSRNCEGGYTCDFHRALATRQSSVKEKIATLVHASKKLLVYPRLKTGLPCSRGSDRAESCTASLFLPQKSLHVPSFPYSICAPLPSRPPYLNTWNRLLNRGLPLLLITEYLLG